MNFYNRERTNVNQRKIKIINGSLDYVGAEALVDITEDEQNVTQQGTPITAEIMTQISQQAETAINVAERVLPLEENLNKIYNSQNDKLTATFIETNEITTNIIDANTISTTDGIELGNKKGVANTPYIDFHTDGNASTDYNIRILATGSELKITASDVKINEKPVNAIHSQCDGCIKFVNGLQICWGQTAETTSTGDLPVNFTQPFAETDYGLSVGVVYAGQNWTSQIYVYSKAKCGFKYYKYAGSSAPMTWIAIGRWKNIETIVGEGTTCQE